MKMITIERFNFQLLITMMMTTTKEALVPWMTYFHARIPNLVFPNEQSSRMRQMKRSV